MYEFNSFIETNDYGGYIIITSTTFERFGTCGSIIRNFKNILSYSAPYSSLVSAKAPDVYMFRANQLQNAIYSDIESEETLTSSSYSCSTTDPTSSNGSCFSITISSSTFEYFNFLMKDQVEPVIVDESLGLHY